MITLIHCTEKLVFTAQQNNILASYDLQASENKIYASYCVQCILNVAGIAFVIFYHDFDCFDVCSNSPLSPNNFKRVSYSGFESVTNIILSETNFGWKSIQIISLQQ